MRILVAEDEAKIAAFIRRGLEEEGYAVDAVGNGQDAFSYASTGNYDALVLDVMLPQLDGLSVCRALRSQGATLPVIMLTAKNSLDDKVGGLDTGADDYLTKPFAFEELVARLRSLLRRSRVIGPPLLRVGDLTLDPSARTVSRDERPIQLSTREYQLLYYLMQHAGTVQSRTTLLSRVWGFDFEGETNVVEVYIRSLRRKIDNGGSPPLIHAV